MIDKIFLINMKKDKIRLNNFTRISKELNFEFEIQEGIKYKDVPKEKLEKYILYDSTLSKNEIGCFMSHITIWEKLLKSDHNKYLIFEDDVETYINEEKFKDILNYQGKYDIFYLGKCLCNCSKLEQIDKNIFTGKAPVCLHSYIITKEFVKKCMEKFPTYKTIDGYIQDIDVKVLMSHPSLFYQDIFTNVSNLRNKYATYNINNECKTNLTTLVSNQDILLFIIIILSIIIIILILMYLFIFKF